MKKQPIPGSLRLWQLVVFLIAPVLCALVCLCIGRMNVPVRDLVSLLLGREVGAQARAVLWSMRLPRVLLAALVGAGLSVSGCVFQSLFANPLATPDTLGVASGASFGAALALLLGFRLIGVQLTAFFFGMVAVSLTCLSGKGSARTTMILSGIMMGSLFSALVSLVKFTADTESQLPAITYWLMGSLSAAGFGALKLGAPAIAVSCGVLLLLRWKLNLLQLPGGELILRVAELAGHVTGALLGEDVFQFLRTQRDQRALHPLPAAVALILHRIGLQYLHLKV